MITLQDAFRNGIEFLEARGIQDAYFEARYLILATTGLELAHLYSYPERILTSAEKSALLQALAKRADGWPSAYITGKREFYGLEFYVDPRVIIPRPETELVVEKALDYAKTCHGNMMIADIGTGSGVIAITLAKSLPDVDLFAVDISEDALEVAKLNAARHGVTNRIRFLLGDLMEPLPQPVDLIAANLPYVADRDVINLSREISSHEPRAGLVGGEDGLEVIRRFLEQVTDKVRPGGCIVMEVGAGQAHGVLEIASACLPRAASKELFQDPNGIDRVIRIVLD